MKKKILFLQNKKEEKEKNINLKIAGKIILKGGVLSKLDINSELGKTKKSYYEYLDEAKGYYNKKIKKLNEQEKEATQTEKNFREMKKPNMRYKLGSK